MKQCKITFIIIFLTIWNIIIAQPENLVPNPSFEEYWLCPSNYGQIARAKGWRSVNFSPDYFHECATDPAYGVPYNFVTFQYPRTGRAYVEIGYVIGTIYPHCENGNSEIISTRLKEKLEINKRYYVTFFVNYAWKDSASLVGSRMIMNKIGVLFSTKDYSMDTTIISHYVSNLDTLPNFSHIYASQIIGDTLNWVEVSGSFIADSAYEYINIGIFYDINNLDTIMVFQYYAHPLGCGATYLIDDVYVGTVPFAEYIKNENLFDIKFNDNVLMITTKANSYSLRIYDVSGRILFFKDVKEEEYCIDISFLAKGMYLVEINNEKNIKKKKILKL